jgi:hypothetical protein
MWILSQILMKLHIQHLWYTRITILRPKYSWIKSMELKCGDVLVTFDTASVAAGGGWTKGLLSLAGEGILPDLCIQANSVMR